MTGTFTEEERGPNGPPAVSVVMSVYNGGARLNDTIRSVLEQRDIDLEFIIVNDGSTDDSPSVLERHSAADSRVVPLHQRNAGLTKALIRGCEMARGRYIARIDSGDLALPGRMKRQSAYLDEHPDVTLVSCWTRYVGPSGEALWMEVRNDSSDEATARLRVDTPATLRGISSHSSAMFRRSDYIRAGGYRPQFRVAQDLDLWMRLTDFGYLAFVPECLCEYRFDPDAISGRCAREQARLTELVVALRKRRDAGLPEDALLARAERLQADTMKVSRAARAGGYYFLGKVLVKRGDRRGLAYLREAVSRDPFHVRAWCSLGWWMLFSRRAGAAET